MSVVNERAELADIDNDTLLEIVSGDITGIDLGGFDLTQDPVNLGAGADSSGTDATAVGVNAVANNRNALAVGESAEATGADATALGGDSTAPANWNTAVGYDAGSANNGENVVVVGRKAEAQGDNSVAVGEVARANGLDSAAFGRAADALAEDATAVGRLAEATGIGSTAIGRGAIASADNSTAVGEGVVVDIPDTFGFGDQNIQLLDTRSVLYPDGVGAQTLVDKVADGTQADGTPIGYALQVDGTVLQTVYAESDGAGGIQNARIDIPVDLSVTGSTTEVDDVVTGDVLIEDGSGTEQFRFDATANPPRADLSGNALTFSAETAIRYDAGSDDIRFRDTASGGDRAALDRTTGDLSISGTLTEGAAL